MRTYYPRTYEATYILGMLAGILSPTNVVGYVAPNPVYGIPAAINAYAQGLRAVRPEGRVVLRWACMPDPDHPLSFADREDVTLYYARDNREASDSHRDYGLCQRLPNGVIRPLGLPEWRWDVFYTEIIPLDPERQLGRRRHRQGHQLLVGHEERRGRHPLQYTACPAGRCSCWA